MELEREMKMLIGAVIYDAVLLLFLVAFSETFWKTTLGAVIWLILLLGLGIVPWLNRLKGMLKS